MIKSILKGKKGITLLEGLIALALLAIVATGTFAVLLSASRKTSAPDLREELVFAVEKAHEQLQSYVYNTDFTLQTKDDKGQYYVPEAFRDGLCGRARFNANTDTNPLGNGTHNIACLLPPVCDRNVANDCNDSTGAKSCFVYRINQASAGRWSSVLPEEGRDKILNSDWTTSEGVYDKDTPKNASAGKTVTFEIRCNGYTLTK